MPAITRPKPTARRKANALRKAPARAKKPFKLELTAEDIALDNAISAAAARSLAARKV
jgi:hypothetical protein